MSLRQSVPILVLALCACGKGEEKKKPAAAAKVEEAAPKADETPPPKKKIHANGMKRFKEPGVYVDGVLVGVLSFAELPVPMPVQWYEERAAVPFKPGDPGPHYRLDRQRRYGFKDYLEAMHVDVAHIKEVHLYGGKLRAAAVVVTGDQLRTEEGFQFRFGGEVYGKPLPSCPQEVGDGKCPDQISSLAVYINKKAPERQGGYFYLDGVKQDGIPYYGKAVHGGVRVYLDGPLATIIKRNKLLASDIKPQGSEGNERWGLFEFLQSQGVKTDKVQEAWIIAKGRRIRRIPRSELVTMTFRAEQGKSGLIMLGDEGIEANALALHTKPISLDQLPQFTPTELEYFKD